MTSALGVQPRMPVALRWAVGGAGLFGLAGLLLTFWLGFEQGSVPLMAASAALVLAAPIAVLLHVTFSGSLKPESRRVWLQEFASAEVWSALSAYLSSQDLDATASQRAEEAAARRASPR